MINEWAQSLVQRFGSPIAVAVELSKGPIVYALQKFDCFVIYPINPSTIAKYRETFTPSGANDPTDAEFAVDLLLRHPDRFKPIQPQSVEMRTLTTLVEQRRNLINDKVCQSALKSIHLTASNNVQQVSKVIPFLAPFYAV